MSDCEHNDDALSTTVGLSTRSKQRSIFNSDPSSTSSSDQSPTTRRQVLSRKPFDRKKSRNLVRLVKPQVRSLTSSSPDSSTDPALEVDAAIVYGDKEQWNTTQPTWPQPTWPQPPMTTPVSASMPAQSQEGGSLRPLQLPERCIFGWFDIIRRNKTSIQAILSVDHRLILNKVYQHELITDREYNNLKVIYKVNVEGHIIELIDTIMGKGEEICRDFLNLLETDDEIKGTFPMLKYMRLNHT